MGVNLKLKVKALEAIKIRESEEIYNLALRDEESLIFIMLLTLYENI